MAVKPKKIGVLYVLHGGMDMLTHQFMWDASVQMFSHDRNHPVYDLVIWNPDAWSMVLSTEFAVKFIKKYEFSYDCIGATDPFGRISELQLAELKKALAENAGGLKFEVDCACWIAADRPERFAYPRFIYNGPGEARERCTYCGENEPGGPWTGCNPERYNVDGPAERLMKKGVDWLVAVDMTVGGVRFYKTFDVVQMIRRVLNEWNEAHRTDIPLLWANDPNNFMERAYPTRPEGWTPMMGDPEEAEVVSLTENPNPVASDPELALLHVEGIEAGMSKAVSEEQTGVMLFNHGLFMPERRFFDPKIDDSTILNKNIKEILLKRHPGMLPENVVGAYGGVKEVNAKNGLLERTRSMRGEELAHAWPYQGASDMPGGEWGYRYWEALEHLKNRGVKHIVIGFPQVVSDSVLTLVEVYNQIGKEIGVKTWLKYKDGEFERYPVKGHPFAEYWGNWVDTLDAKGREVCFTMGGCKDGRPYPPLRKTPIEEKCEDMDPCLAFDLCDYGHLGYDSAKGPPDPEGPVQGQYTGTWELYTPPNSDPRLGKLLARHVLNILKQHYVNG